MSAPIRAAGSLALWRACGFVVAATAVATAAGCVDGDTRPPSEDRIASLTGAVPDSGDPGVVAIMFDDHAACTGVLVANRVVLTAAHCLVGHSALPRVLVGSDVAAPDALIEVAEIFMHAAFNPLSPAHDIAALRLDQDAPLGVAPLARTRSSFVAGTRGSTARLVGFGHDSNVAPTNTPHVKRQGMATITAVGTDTITLGPAPSQACVGDSGGPVLTEALGGEVLVGLVLGGITSCTDTATALRVDTYADSFIDPVIAGLPPAPAGDPGPSSAAGGCTLGPRPSDPPSFIFVGLWGALLLGSRRGR